MTEEEKLEFERQKLELDKQRLDLERQKFDFKKSIAEKSGEPTFKGFSLSNGDSKPNIWGIIGSAILAISPFFPWSESSSSASGFGVNISGSQSYTGFEMGQGYYILIFAIAACFLAYKNNKWVLIPAILAIADGASLMFGLSGWSSSGSSMGASFHAHTGISFGVIIAMVAGVIIGSSPFIKSSSISQNNESQTINIRDLYRRYEFYILLLTLVLLTIIFSYNFIYGFIQLTLLTAIILLI